MVFRRSAQVVPFYLFIYLFMLLLGVKGLIKEIIKCGQRLSD